MTTSTPLPSSCFASTLLVNGTTPMPAWSCPASFTFSFAGDAGKLQAELTCPAEPNANSLEEFRNATQQPTKVSGCQCTNTMLLPSQQSMDCYCYGCPVGSQFGAGYVCSTPIFGNCKSFNCHGACNGVPDFPHFLMLKDETTDLPTSSPTIRDDPEESTTSSPTSLPMEAEEGTTSPECDLVDGLDHYVCNADLVLDDLLLVEDDEDETTTSTAFLQAKLICPVEHVEDNDGDLAATSHRGLCACETDLFLASRRSTSGFGSSAETDENHIDESALNCECYICPPNSRLDYAYSCDGNLVVANTAAASTTSNHADENDSPSCLVLNCDGICDGPLDFLQIMPDREEPDDSPSVEEIIDGNGEDGSRASSAFRSSIMMVGKLSAVLYCLLWQ